MMRRDQYGDVDDDEKFEKNFHEKHYASRMVVRSMNTIHGGPPHDSAKRVAVSNTGSNEDSQYNSNRRMWPSEGEHNGEGQTCVA